MTTQELRELDAWIAEHVMGWIKVESVLQIFGKDQFSTNSEFKEPPRVIIYEGYSRVQSWIPTERQGDAMDVLKKCAEKLDREDIRIGFCTGTWSIQSVYRENTGARGRIWIHGAWPETNTLEEIICLFAKQLFSQTTK